MTTNPGLQSISDLTASTRLTTGDTPPPLVGSSTTVIGTHLYLFAGRLVSSRRMTNELYVLDLNTFVWTKIQDNDQRTPKARYFHSANQYKNSILVFGGMGYSRTSNDGLCVLDDVSIFDLETYTWKHPEIISSNFSPRPRYAHLASVTANKLVVVGGQDMSNFYIEEINVLDLEEMTWTSSRPFEKHCGAYRSVAVSSFNHTSLPLIGINNNDTVPLSSSDDSSSQISQETNLSSSSSTLRKSNSTQNLSIDPNSPTPNNSNSIRKLPSVGAFGRQGSLKKSPSGQNFHTHSIKRLQSSGDIVNRLLYTTKVTEENPNPIYLYSNYNFTDVKRELQVIAPPTSTNYQIMDHSGNMTGATLPPGLRFPTGAILGHYLIISGTFLTNTNQTFSIWALNLANLVWLRIDTGSCFQQGSWNRGVLCEVLNKYFVLGHRDRSLVEDYNHRQTNFDHVTVVDLEAFGIYQPPSATMSPIAQELGLSMMKDLNITDFEIVTSDKERIPVNSQLLSHRWPHFKALVDQQAERAPRLKYDGETQHDPEDDEPILMYHHRALEFPEPYPVTIAFLQYLYTDHLLTPQQYQPQVLAQLLLLADMYDLSRLRQLASHALHQSLNMTTAALIYETAALSRQTGLQIRALKVMIAAKKMLQQNKEQLSSRGVSSINGAIKAHRESILEQEMSSPSNWAPTSSNPASPPNLSMHSDSRTSYFDPFPPTVNSSSQSGPVHTTRSRSSSSVSAYTISNRGHLPTIQDNATSVNNLPYQQRLRSSQSSSSLNLRPRNFMGNNNNVQVHQQSITADNRSYQPGAGFGYVN
ncbi:5865_t:CDS:1 [Diversispora eburnea]|uniref:5865_t:CDS:1 n=1 Tax=Diversispora eburnea TaxID=1213867 RepID=A0A9N8V8C4_9GLOM|nr:5865_t:CDS:1 [Diversispora eburnea]